VKKLDRHFGYYQCSLCGKKKGALYGETGAIGSNCSNVLRHTAGESHLRAWLADLPVEAEKPTLAELQTCVLLAVCPSIPARGALSRRSQVDRAQVAGPLGSERSKRTTVADQGAGAAQGAEGGDQRGGRRRRGCWPGGGGGADADDAGGYAAAPLLRRDHAGGGGRLGSADGGRSGLRGGRMRP